MKILVKWASLTVAIYILALYTPAIAISGPKVAIFAALVLGLLNTILRPILKVLTLPINIISLGLFSFIINGLMIYLIPRFIDGFSVKSFWWAVGGAIIISIITSILNSIFLPKKLETDGL